MLSVIHHPLSCRSNASYVGIRGTIPAPWLVGQDMTCVSMVAGQEEGLVAPEVVEKINDEFMDVFKPIDACPPVRGGVDHVIRLQQGSSPSFMRPFRMSKHEEEECMKQVQDALGKGL